MRAFVDHPASPVYNPGMPGDRPLIALRLPVETDARLRAVVEATGTTISDYVRDAIDAKLAGTNTQPRSTATLKPKRSSGGGKCQHRQPSGSYCGKCGSIVP